MKVFTEIYLDYAQELNIKNQIPNKQLNNMSYYPQRKIGTANNNINASIYDLSTIRNHEINNNDNTNNQGMASINNNILKTHCFSFNKFSIIITIKTNEMTINCSSNINYKNEISGNMLNKKYKFISEEETIHENIHFLPLNNIFNIVFYTQKYINSRVLSYVNVLKFSQSQENLFDVDFSKTLLNNAFDKESVLIKQVEFLYMMENWDLCFALLCKVNSSNSVVNGEITLISFNCYDISSNCSLKIVNEEYEENITVNNNSLNSNNSKLIKIVKKINIQSIANLLKQSSSVKENIIETFKSYIFSNNTKNESSDKNIVSKVLSIKYINNNVMLVLTPNSLIAYCLFNDKVLFSREINLIDNNDNSSNNSSNNNGITFNNSDIIFYQETYEKSIFNKNPIKQYIFIIYIDYLDISKKQRYLLESSNVSFSVDLSSYNQIKNNSNNNFENLYDFVKLDKYLSSSNIISQYLSGEIISYKAYNNKLWIVNSNIPNKINKYLYDIKTINLGLVRESVEENFPSNIFFQEMEQNNFKNIIKQIELLSNDYDQFELLSSFILNFNLVSDEKLVSFFNLLSKRFALFENENNFNISNNYNPSITAFNNNFDNTSNAFNIQENISSIHNKNVNTINKTFLTNNTNKRSLIENQALRKELVQVQTKEKLKEYLNRLLQVIEYKQNSENYVNNNDTQNNLNNFLEINLLKNLYEKCLNAHFNNQVLGIGTIFTDEIDGLYLLREKGMSVFKGIANVSIFEKEVFSLESEFRDLLIDNFSLFSKSTEIANFQHKQKLDSLEFTCLDVNGNNALKLVCAYIRILYTDALVKLEDRNKINLIVKESVDVDLYSNSIIKLMCYNNKESKHYNNSFFIILREKLDNLLYNFTDNILISLEVLLKEIKEHLLMSHSHNNNSTNQSSKQLNKINYQLIEILNKLTLMKLKTAYVLLRDSCLVLESLLVLIYNNNDLLDKFIFKYNEDKLKFVKKLLFEYNHLFLQVLLSYYVATNEVVITNKELSILYFTSEVEVEELSLKYINNNKLNEVITKNKFVITYENGQENYSSKNNLNSLNNNVLSIKKTYLEKIIINNLIERGVTDLLEMSNHYFSYLLQKLWVNENNMVSIINLINKENNSDFIANNSKTNLNIVNNEEVGVFLKLMKIVLFEKENPNELYEESDEIVIDNLNMINLENNNNDLMEVESNIPNLTNINNNYMYISNSKSPQQLLTKLNFNVIQIVNSLKLMKAKKNKNNGNNSNTKNMESYFLCNNQFQDSNSDINPADLAFFLFMDSSSILNRISIKDFNDFERFLIQTNTISQSNIKKDFTEERRILYFLEKTLSYIENALNTSSSQISNSDYYNNLIQFYQKILFASHHLFIDFYIVDEIEAFEVKIKQIITNLLLKSGKIIEAVDYIRDLCLRSEKYVSSSIVENLISIILNSGYNKSTQFNNNLNTNKNNKSDFLLFKANPLSNALLRNSKLKMDYNNKDSIFFDFLSKNNPSIKTFIFILNNLPSIVLNLLISKLQNFVIDLFDNKEYGNIINIKDYKSLFKMNKNNNNSNNNANIQMNSDNYNNNYETLLSRFSENEIPFISLLSFLYLITGRINDLINSLIIYIESSYNYIKNNVNNLSMNQYVEIIQNQNKYLKMLVSLGEQFLIDGENKNSSINIIITTPITQDHSLYNVYSSSSNMNIVYTHYKKALLISNLKYELMFILKLKYEENNISEDSFKLNSNFICEFESSTELKLFNISSDTEDMNNNSIIEKQNNLLKFIFYSNQLGNTGFLSILEYLNERIVFLYFHNLVQKIVSLTSNDLDEEEYIDNPDIGIEVVKREIEASALKMNALKFLYKNKLNYFLKYLVDFMLENNVFSIDSDFDNEFFWDLVEDGIVDVESELLKNYPFIKKFVENSNMINS